MFNVSGMPRLGEAGEVASTSAIICGAGGARIALHTEPFPSLLPSERLYSDFVDSFFSRKSSHTPKLAWYYEETNFQSIVLLEKSLKTTPVEEHAYTKVCPQRKPCPPALGTCRHPCSVFILKVVETAEEPDVTFGSISTTFTEVLFPLGSSLVISLAAYLLPSACIK